MLGARDVASDPIPRWIGSEIRATAERRRRGLRTSLHVDLEAAHVRATLAADELLRLLDGRIEVAESIAGPLAFLCTTASASPDSPLAPLLATVEPDALALIADPMDRVAATIASGERGDFAAWVRALPR